MIENWIFLLFCFIFKVSTSTRIKYPNYYNLHFKVSFYMSQRPPFLCCTSLDDSPIVHPSVFRHAQGNRAVQEHQAFVALYYRDTIHIWHKTWRRQERTEYGKEQIWNEWIPPRVTVSSTEFFLHFCFLTWKGANWKKPPPGLLFFMLPITRV